MRMSLGAVCVRATFFTFVKKVRGLRDGLNGRQREQARRFKNLDRQLAGERTRGLTKYTDDKMIEHLRYVEERAKISPVHRGHFIEILRNVEVAPWNLKGGPARSSISRVPGN